MQGIPSWDDIGSIKLELDDGTNKDSSMERRRSSRLSSKDIKNLLHGKIKVIQVQVATYKGVLPHKGFLENIHENGICFNMPGHGLNKDDTIIVATLIGKRVLKTQAIVRWHTEEKAGVEFIRPNADDISFLKELLSAKAYNYRI